MTPQQIAALSKQEKLKEAILRSFRLMPGDIAAELKGFLTPKTLSIMVGSLVGLAVAQAFGVGEFADALLLLVALGYCGRGAIAGLKDIGHFVRTALDARSDPDLDRAAQYFANAVVEIGITALMALLLKKPVTRFRKAGGFSQFRTMNYKPNLLALRETPPAPGTRPSTVFKSIPDSLGTTDAYGNIEIDSGLDATEQQITLNHELVHRFFSPKFGPFLELRARLNVSGYNRSVVLRYLEEAMAEGYAQVRAQGFRGVITGLRFPLKGYGYLSIAERAEAHGQFLGIIVVNGQAMTVSIRHELPPAKEQRPAAASPSR